MPTPRPSSTDEVAYALRKAIRAERVRRDITQEELARRLGMPRRSISDVETGERTITASELPEICAALGVTLASLLSEVPAARRKLGLA